MGPISVIVQDANNLVLEVTPTPETTVILDRGIAGPTGSPGTAATIAVGTTTTLSPGASATVSNAGTSNAAVFDFGIPQGPVGNTGPTGATGAQGIPGINWLGFWNSATTYAIRDAVSYNGSSYYAIAANTNEAPPNASFWNLLAQKGTDGTGAGTVTSVGGTGTVNGITLTGTVTTSGNLTLGGTLSGVDLTTQVTGTLPVANGGTGATSLTANNVILGNGTSAVQEVAPGTTGNVLTSDGTTWTSSPLPASEVTLNGVETLTNKTLTSPVINTPTGIVKGDVGLGNVDNTSDATKDAATATLTNKTLTAPVLTSPVINDGYTEEVFAVSGTTPALSPTNGSIQTWTLTANSTPTAGTWAAGQSITLMVDDGTTYTVTWTSLAVTWKTTGGTAPTLATSGYTVITLWKVGTTIYGAVLP